MARPACPGALPPDPPPDPRPCKREYERTRLAGRATRPLHRHHRPGAATARSHRLQPRLTADELAEWAEWNRRLAERRAHPDPVVDEQDDDIIVIPVPYEPGIYRDLWLLKPLPPVQPGVRDPHYATPEWQAALERVVALSGGNSVRTTNVTVKSSAPSIGWPGDEGVYIRAVMLPALRDGLLLALASINRPQKVRFGQQRLADERGQEIEIPLDFLGYDLSFGPASTRWLSGGRRSTNRGQRLDGAVQI